jgi:hypothetical protein
MKRRIGLLLMTHSVIYDVKIMGCEKKERQGLRSVTRSVGLRWASLSGYRVEPLR